MRYLEGAPARNQGFLDSAASNLGEGAGRRSIGLDSLRSLFTKPPVALTVIGNSSVRSGHPPNRKPRTECPQHMGPPATYPTLVDHLIVASSCFSEPRQAEPGAGTSSRLSMSSKDKVY